jgi:biopolymer transport protein ExbD
MDFNRLLAVLPAPFAGLFLVLSLLAFVAQTPVSEGIRIPVIRLHHDAQEPTDCDGRSEFVRLTADGKTWINSGEVPENRLTVTIADLMENRAERVAYLVAVSDLSYGQFAGVLDKVTGAATDLHIVVVSGEIRRALETNGELLCDFVYPAVEFRPVR